LVRLRLYVLAQILGTKKTHLPLAFNSSHIAFTQAKAGLFTKKMNDISRAPSDLWSQTQATRNCLVSGAFEETRLGSFKVGR